MSNAVENPPAAAEISHPKPTRPWPSHFAAYGFVQGVGNVFGRLRNQTTGAIHEGKQISPPSSDTGFWIIHFVLPDTFPVGGNDKYTLEVFDANDRESGTVVPPVADLTFFHSSKGGPIHPNTSSVVVTYPQNYDQVGTQFTAYGSAPDSLPVTGTYSGCTGSITQHTPGPDWVLNCTNQGTSGSQCTLTVSQSGATSGQGTFEIT